MSTTTSVVVAVRVRPFKENEVGHKCCISMDGKNTVITNLDDGTTKTFTYDYSYWSFDKNHPNYADQQRVYEDLGLKVLENAWAGYNTSLFAYGQTGSGKSYSVVGYGAEKGIVPRVSEEIFNRISGNSDTSISFRVELSMLEIYNEEVRDLLNPKSGTLELRENKQVGVYVDGLSKVPVRSYKEIADYMEKGNQMRTIKSTNMNATSSRAHTVFQISFTKIQKVKQGDKELSSEKKSLINLIDLAGSERVDKTGAQGATLKEGININKSLTMLGMVINKLAEACKSKKETHIPYRDSKLTFLLRESLGGNSKTIMVAAISPSFFNFSESLSTLQYASRAKLIENKAVVNEDSTAKMIRELKAENERLKKLLEEKGTNPSGTSGSSVPDEDMDKITEQLNQSQQLLKEMMTSMEEKQKEIESLTAAQKEALEKAGLKPAVDPSKYARLTNLNEDPLLTDTLHYFFTKPSTTIGSDTTSDIVFSGVGVLGKHAIVACDKDVCSIEPCDNTAVIMVNGKQITQKTVLHTSDRLIISNNYVFKFVNPKEPSNFSKTISWTMAQSEVFAAEEELRNKIKALQEQFENEKKAQQKQLDTEYKKLEEAKKNLESSVQKSQQDEKSSKIQKTFIGAIARVQQEKKDRDAKSLEEQKLALLAVQDTELNVLINEANTIAKQFSQPISFSKKLKIENNIPMLVIEALNNQTNSVALLKRDAFESKVEEMKELYQFAKGQDNISGAVSEAFNYSTKLIGYGTITAKELMKQKIFKVPTLSVKHGTENGFVNAELSFNKPIDSKSQNVPVTAVLKINSASVRQKYNKNVHVNFKFFMDQSYRKTNTQAGGSGTDIAINFAHTYHIPTNYYDELAQYVEGDGEISFQVYGEKNPAFVEPSKPAPTTSTSGTTTSIVNNNTSISTNSTSITTAAVTTGITQVKANVVEMADYAKIVQENMLLKKKLMQQEEEKLKLVNQKLAQKDQLLKDVANVKLDVFTCVRVHVVSANNLPKMDLIGRGDPYVEVFCRGVWKQTKVIINNSNPVWDEEFIIMLQSPPTLQESLLLNIYDYDDITSNDKIGTVEIPFVSIQQFQREGNTLQTYTVKLASKKPWHTKTSTISVDCSFGIL